MCDFRGSEAHCKDNRMFPNIKITAKKMFANTINYKDCVSVDIK